ncbi:hypothetical protein Y032_0039g14 [Ancylostoma ceylanicum]|uniref:Secreted protein n=1 Tax=Ancylostoma ceylanicum TaxID=53326 RepID=A0A016UHV7_9BILA|nr:hypothetical protein Y032_0039g14 [Ancylostoma ceylanicum]
MFYGVKDQVWHCFALLMLLFELQTMTRNIASRKADNDVHRGRGSDKSVDNKASYMERKNCYQMGEAVRTYAGTRPRCTRMLPKSSFFLQSRRIE